MINIHYPIVTEVVAVTQMVSLPVMPRIVPPGFSMAVSMLLLVTVNLKCSHTCRLYWEKIQRMHGCQGFTFGWLIPMTSAPVDLIS